MGGFGFDPNIILAGMRQQQESPSEALKTGMGLGQLLRQQGRENMLASLTSQNAGAYSDPTARAFALGGFGEQAAAAQQAAIERQMQAQKLQSIHADLMRSRATMVKTPEQAEQFISGLHPEAQARYGFTGQEKGPEAQAAIKSFITSGISPKDQAQQEIERNKLEPFGFSQADPITGAIYKMDKRSGQTAQVSSGTAPATGGAPAGKPLQVQEYKEKILSALHKDLDRSQGKSNLAAKDQAQIEAADRFEALLNAPGPFTAQRLHEATMMAATIANNGNVPTEKQVEAMLPQAYKNRGTAFWQSATAIPMDVGMQPFVDLMRKQSERETEVANKHIRQYFLERLVGHPQAFSQFPEEANKMAEGAGLKGLYDPKTLLPLKHAAHAQDSVAVEWAKKHLNDPKLGAKAKAILQANGVE